MLAKFSLVTDPGFGVHRLRVLILVVVLELGPVESS
jgi:hypothetical protein